MQKRVVISLFALAIPLLADTLSTLLDEYRVSSDLSNITKIDTAGFVDVFTRDDLEKMQVKTLNDVLQTLPILTLSRTQTGDFYFSKPSANFIPTTAVRIFINDHDVTSSACGTVSEYWLDMPVEFIDHIEVYKTASSIEFSNEPATAIIRLYTKVPERENGNKLRLLTDTKGSFEGDFYRGVADENGVGYFTYLHNLDLHNKRYLHEGKTLSKDLQDTYFFTQFKNAQWRGEVSYRKKSKDNYLGYGRNVTPNSGYSSTSQFYWHIKRKFENGVDLHLAYDRMKIHRFFSDNSGIFAGAAGYVSSYHFNITDDTFSLIVNKNWRVGKHNIYAGMFHKYKRMHQFGRYDGAYNNFTFTTHLSSVYIEDRYNFAPNATLIASLKGDLYAYDKAVQTHKKLISRIGYIYKKRGWTLKAFATNMYVPAEPYKLYNEGSLPFYSNANLRFPTISFAMVSARKDWDKDFLEVRASLHRIKNACYVNDEGQFDNRRRKIKKSFQLIRYGYNFDTLNRLTIDLFHGSNSLDGEYSPAYGAMIRTYNQFGNFELYNQFIYRCAYELYGIEVDNTFDYTFAVKYRYKPDLTFGLRGENIFNDGYKQAYSNLPYPLPVNDQKIWFNIEYYF